MCLTTGLKNAVLLALCILVAHLLLRTLLATRLAVSATAAVPPNRPVKGLASGATFELTPHEPAARGQAAPAALGPAPSLTAAAVPAPAPAASVSTPAPSATAISYQQHQEVLPDSADVSNTVVADLSGAITGGTTGGSLTDGGAQADVPRAFDIADMAGFSTLESIDAVESSYLDTAGFASLDRVGLSSTGSDDGGA
jgi:hypothetical protein